MTRDQMTEVYAGLRARKDEYKEALKKVQEDLDQAERDLVLIMENENLTSFKDDRFGTIYLRDEIRASVENQEVLFPWLREHQLGDCIKETIHAKTLSALVKEHPEMPGTKTFIQTQLGMRK